MRLNKNVFAINRASIFSKIILGSIITTSLWASVSLEKAPSTSSSHYWIEAEGGIYGFSKNQAIIAAINPPPTTGPTPIPTAPGFIGLYTTSIVTNSLLSSNTPSSGGGGIFRLGYWLNPMRTIALDGSIFYTQGKSKFSLSPTTTMTSIFINTTPGVYVHLYDDSTTTTLTNNEISDKLLSMDANVRMKMSPAQNLLDFDFMIGARFAMLDEKFSSTFNSAFSRNFETALGLPGSPDFINTTSGIDSFKIRNLFFGPQIGFNAQKHWGLFWVASENKVAIGGVAERVYISGNNVSSITPTQTLSIAGIPLEVNSGGTPVVSSSGKPAFGLFAQNNRKKAKFAVVPNGNIKLGYEIMPQKLSLTVAYNYLYISNVGRVGEQINSSNEIKQSGLFVQGVTLGVKTLV